MLVAAVHPCIPEPKPMTVYSGNESGDIVAVHISPPELTALSGEAGGPVPCQRSANHNPYRAVRVRLTPHKANTSWQTACRAQRQASALVGSSESRREATIGQQPSRYALEPSMWLICVGCPPRTAHGRQYLPLKSLTWTTRQVQIHGGRRSNRLLVDRSHYILPTYTAVVFTIFWVDLRSEPREKEGRTQGKTIKRSGLAIPIFPL